MTEPTPVADLTVAELNQAIITASRKMIAAWRTRDPEQVAAAQAAYDELLAERDARG